MTALSPVLSAQLLLNADAIVDLLGRLRCETCHSPHPLER